MSCIYCIYNNINDRIYIGSTINYSRRIYNHIRDLNKNKHHNYKLQKDWNLYGSENFDIFKLKDSNQTILLEDEQWSMDILRPYYNICKIAGNTLNLKWTEKRRKKQMLYISNFSHSHKNNLSISMKKNKEFIKKATERCKLMTELNKRKIIAINIKTKEELYFNSIKEASNFLNINKNNIQSRLSNIVKSPFKEQYIFKYNN